MDYFTTNAKKAINMAADIAISYNHRYVGTEHILMALFKAKGVGGRVLNKFTSENEYVEVMKDISGKNPVNSDNDEFFGFTERARDVLNIARQKAAEHNLEKVGTGHLLIGILFVRDCIAVRVLNTLAINIQQMYYDVLSEYGYSDNEAKKKVSLFKKTGGKVTSYLDQYTRDLTALAEEGRLDPVIGRNEEITRVIQVLCRRMKNNPCLVGEPGVGKTAIVEGLAGLVAEGAVPDYIKNIRIHSLDLSGMIAGSKYRGEFEERIKRLMDEIKADKNIILFVDELHTIIGAGSAEGTMDAANILKPALSRGEIRIIGATTREEYRKYIEKDAALERRFQPVNVDEPDESEAIEILSGISKRYEQFHGLTVSEDAVNAAVKLSKRYVNDRFLPDKAIDCLDEACSKAKLKGYKINPQVLALENRLEELTLMKEDALVKKNYEQMEMIKDEEAECRKKISKLKGNVKSKRKIKVTAEDVADIICSWTGIPVSKLSENENEKLLNLEKNLHKRVIGQNEAISSVAKAIRRGRTGLKDPNRPIGSFLFLGPTGVGKTELSKALAEAVFGRESAIIRVDMSEYMEKHSVAKMVGSPPGYVGHEDGGQLSEQVRQKPYSIVLFDEIEKAHPDVFNILLQVLDEGHITDSHGRRVSFKDTIIIMTSNAGAQSIISPKKLGFKKDDDKAADYEQMKSGVMEEVKKIFKPEFINRIDDIIVFHELSGEELENIVKLLLNSLKRRLEDTNGMKLSFSKEVITFIAEKGNNPKYGARPIKRAIQDYIEDVLADEMLSGNIHPGDTVKLKLKDNKISVSL
ncbi:MAG: ATP-dependent Clp protease ATP-binding subunit [Lachnospiraceae bacterium]